MNESLYDNEELKQELEARDKKEEVVEPKEEKVEEKENKPEDLKHMELHLPDGSVEYFKPNGRGEWEVPDEFLMDDGITIDKQKLKRFAGQVVLVFANGTFEKLSEKFAILGSQISTSEDVLKLPKEIQWWYSAAIEAADCLNGKLIGINYDMINQREHGRWRNIVETKDKRRLGMMTTTLKDISGREVVTGRRALDVFDRISGLGRTIKVPLWHTGIWVTLRSPTLSAYVELQQQMTEEKIDMGRRSRGAIFSADVSILSERAVDVILECVEDTNAMSKDRDYLKSIIRLQDLNILLWGAICTMYPNGFKLTNICTSTDTDCHHLWQEDVDLRKLLWVDMNTLTEKQINIMNKGVGREKITEEVLIEYQEEFPVESRNRFLINSWVERPVEDEGEAGIRMVFRSPTLAEYFQQSAEWIAALEANSVKSMGTPLVGENRSRYIDKQVKATILMRYAHFIEKIEMDDGDPENIAVVTSRLDIGNILVRLSSNNTAIASFAEAINKFINNDLVAVVGYPNRPCPKCGKAYGTTNSPSKHIVPLDVLSTFFIHSREATRNLTEE